MVPQKGPFNCKRWWSEWVRGPSSGGGRRPEIGALTGSNALVISVPAKGIRGMGLLGDIADFGKGVVGNNLKWTERAARVGELIVRNTAGSELERASAFGGQVADLSHKAANFFASQIGGRVIRAARSPVLAAGQ